MKIMFVCMGNICRSPLAHAVFAHKVHVAKLDHAFETESSGTISYHVGSPADPRARKTAADHGIAVTHLARHLKKADLDDFDLILVMDRDNLSHVQKMASTDAQRKKIRLFRQYDPDRTDGDEVPDPYYGNEDGFELVFEMVERTSENLLRVLTEKGGPEA